MDTTCKLRGALGTSNLKRLSKPSQLDGDYFQPNPRQVAQPSNNGVMWDGKGYIPIPHGVAAKMPEYEFVLADGSVLTNPVVEASEEVQRGAPGTNQFSRRRRTALPDDELLVPAKFVTQDFVTTQDSTTGSFFLMPEGTVLGSAMTYTGTALVKPGFTLPAGTLFTAGASIPTGTVVPAGTLFKEGTRIPDTIHLPGSAGYLSASYPPSPIEEKPFPEFEPIKTGIAMSSMEGKRALLEQLRRRARRSSGIDYSDFAPKHAIGDVIPTFSSLGAAPEAIGLEQSSASDNSDSLMYIGGHYQPPH